MGCRMSGEGKPKESFMAEDPNRAAREKVLEQNRKAVEQSQKEFGERTGGKPTPTQDENDRAALGEHIHQHEDDGSGPDPYAKENQEAQRRTTGGTREAPQQSQQAPRTSQPHRGPTSGSHSGS
jgi:hypothetical protein